MKKYIIALMFAVTLCLAGAAVWAMSGRQTADGYLDKTTGKFWTQEELDALPKYSTPDPKIWPLPPQTVAEKKELLHKLLTLHEPPYRFGFDEKICKGLFASLRDGTAEILEPEFVTQSMDDPRMKKVTDGCPKLYLDKYWGYKSELDARTAAEPGRGPEDWDWLAVEHGQAYANFALFKFDPKLTGGADYAFFAEGWNKGSADGDVKVFNTSTCAVSNRFVETPRYSPYDTRLLTKPNTSGFIKFDDAYYFFNIIASEIHLNPSPILGKWSLKHPYISIWKIISKNSEMKVCQFTTPMRNTLPEEAIQNQQTTRE